MNHVVHHKIVAILLLFCIFFLSYTYYRYFYNPHKRIPKITGTKLTISQYEKIKIYYVALVDNQNPRIALTKLREQIKTDSALAASCHALAHELGHEAFTKYKDFGNALSYQDEVCNSGYLHGVIESYFLSAKSLSYAMQTVCQKYLPNSFTAWECYHGVGHGVMYYTGNDIFQSLYLCDSYADDFAKNVCANGIFMENFNTDQKLHPSKFLKENDPFYPCNTKNIRHTTDCYLYAPIYYLSMHSFQYHTALQWCTSAPPQYQSACISGVGSEAMKENITNPKLIESICMDDTDRAACIRGMVSLYINHYGSLEPAKAMCRQLEFSNRETCDQVISSMTSLFQKT